MQIYQPAPLVCSKAPHTASAMYVTVKTVDGSAAAHVTGYNALLMMKMTRSL